MSTSAASSFLVIGERTNITGSPKFAKAIKAGDWDACLAIARQQGARWYAQQAKAVLDDGAQ